MAHTRDGVVKADRAEQLSWPLRIAAMELQVLEQAAAQESEEQVGGDDSGENAVNGNGQLALEVSEGLETKDKDEGTSRPPSPPSREDTPPEKKAFAAHCPARLKPYVPPFNYGAVTTHKIFRSSFPLERNVEFLKELEIKTILALVSTEPCEAYVRYLEVFNVQRVHVDISPNKHGNVSTTVESICEALLTLMDTSNHPLYIHCNQGKHRTGCLVACLRKVQKWPIEDVLDEYRAYASPKVRPGDVAFIESFQPAFLFDYAKDHGYFKKLPVLQSLESVLTNVDALVDALTTTGIPALDISSSSASDRSDPSTVVSDGLADPMLTMGIDPMLEPKPHNVPATVTVMSAVEELPEPVVGGGEIAPEVNVQEILDDD